jgi:hypothetical protein
MIVIRRATQPLGFRDPCPDRPSGFVLQIHSSPTTGPGAQMLSWLLRSDIPGGISRCAASAGVGVRTLIFWRVPGGEKQEI